MNATSEYLHFMQSSPLVGPESGLWRPPSFPPPDDWVLSINKHGEALSRYGDQYWRFSAFGYRGFNFGKQGISDSNLRIVKQVLIFVLYHPNFFPGKISSVQIYFRLLIKIAKVCDQQGVLISELSKFPRLYSSVSVALQGSWYNEYINKLHKLRIYENELGFVIANKQTIEFLVASKSTKKETIQHPYIPPRLWTYQVNRLSECLDDFLHNREAIEQAFTWLSDTYEYNASCPVPDKLISPFGERGKYKQKRIIYEGDFECFLANYKLYDLISKWIVKGKQITIQDFSKYLNLVAQASLFYILNFSMQRSSEVVSLTTKCFYIEKDKKLGEIAIIIGETSKTDPDSDARWVVPKSVGKAVEASTVIAKLRNRHKLKIDNSILDKNDNQTLLPLLARNFEPWIPDRHKELTRQYIDYQALIRTYPKLFDLEKITVTEADWKIALSLTPNLDKKAGFGVGLPWRFSGHQLRRTTCVNMFASHMVSDKSLQWEMKHLTRDMTLYYGRNYTNLKLNSEVETAVIVESYRAIYRQLVELINDTVKYIRPHQKEMISTDVINLVGASEEKQLISLIKKGSVGCRKTLLGFCMRSGTCEYGGIESVAKCAGTNKNSICSDAIFDSKNKDKLINLKLAHEQEMINLQKDTPRYNALKQEIYAIGTYINVING